MENTIDNGINTGVRVEPLKMGAFIAGLESGIVYSERNPSGDYTKYLPTDEYQSSLIFDTMACVTFSGNNVAEMIFTMLIEQGKISKENIEWLKKNGYFDANGKINFSDRFSAKVDGTTKTGNSMDNYWLSVRNVGLIPESMWSWDRSSKFDWDQYYSEPTKECYAMAEEFKKRFECLYEVVLYFSNTPNPNQREILEKYLKQSPLHIATITASGWSRKDGKPVKNNVCGWNHATAVFNIKEDGTYEDFDHYDPCKKLLSSDYCINIVYSAVFSEKAIKPTPVPDTVLTHEFKTTLRYNQTSPEVKLLQEALKALGYFLATPTGYFGNITKASVIKFQKANGLVGDGIFGKLSCAILNQRMAEFKKKSLG